jgi:hypothetical protein
MEKKAKQKNMVGGGEKNDPMHRTDTRPERVVPRRLHG